MNKNDLYEAIGKIDENLLDRSEKNIIKRRSKKPWWIGITAAAIAVIIVVGVFYMPRPFSPNDNNPPAGIIKVSAISEAEYPKMAPYPNENDADFENQYEKWQSSIDKQRQEEGYAKGMESFFLKTSKEFLSDSNGKNCAYSPLSTYMALSMLSELTEGESRQQILSLLGEENIEDVRKRANAVWNGNYRNDGATTSILANSLWLNESVAFDPKTMESLAKIYYASSFKGAMGSENYNKALQNWINEQTGGLLKEQSKDLEMNVNTVMALASTIYFSAKWEQEFSEKDTYTEKFHTLNGDVDCDFMHQKIMGTYYYRGKNFGAVEKKLRNDGGTMWLLLPDEGIELDKLLNDPEVGTFLFSKTKSHNRKYVSVNLSLPKFDITSDMELKENLKKLGVTDIFDEKKADFSPMTKEVSQIAVSEVSHDVRVAIDEEGVTAASYTVIMNNGKGYAPEEKDFVLDRPFLFVITNPDGLPTFIGTIYNP